VKVLTRRRYRQPAAVIRVGNLLIDAAAQKVSRGGERIELTRREYALLHYLAVRQGENVSRTEIWENVYAFDSDAHSNVVDVYIRYLRKKLERPGAPALIHTRRGFGYCLDCNEVEA
jgi:DNA-binding response OmpR family regulator